MVLLLRDYKKSFFFLQVIDKGFSLLSDRNDFALE